MVDNLIKLFDSEETEFETNGLGVLADAKTCEVTEERNDEFELEMDYPITGRHYKDIAMRKIIVAKPNPYSSPQPFRIYDISKPIDGIVTIYAEHISYDLSGYPVSAFSLEEANTTIQNVFDEFKRQCVRKCPFTFWTNKITTGRFSLAYPRSIRSLLAGSEGSIIDRYGTAEYEFDGYSVKLWMSRGEDRGVYIRYGKNLTDLEQEENCSSVYTAVYPYWYSETDNKLVTLHESDVEDSSQKDDEGNDSVVHIPDKIVEVDGTFSFVRILTLDLSDKFTEAPSELDLYKAAKKYIKDNEVGIPKVSIEVSFEALSKTSDYKNYAILEDVRLCDTVYVEFPELGVSATAKCVKTIYDVLADKYKKIELGSIKSNLANSLSNQSKILSNTTSKSYVDNLLDDTIMAISGNSGGYVVIHSSKGEKHPDEILIMDAPELEDAKRIWRWNMSGLCYTDEYYSSFGEGNGKGVAITMDGKIVADFIAGNMIQGVGLQTAPDPKGEVWFSVTQDGTLTARKGIIGGCEIQNGVLKIKDANIDGKISANNIDVKDLEVSGRFVLSGVVAGELEGDIPGYLLESDGSFRANNAFIGGTIYANAGQIAGFNINRTDEYDEDGQNLLSIIRKLGNKEDTFHILSNEDVESGVIKTEVLITDLICDEIKAADGYNSIDLSYKIEGKTTTSTARLSSKITSQSSGIVSITFSIDIDNPPISDKIVTINYGLKDEDENLFEFVKTVTINKDSHSRTVYATAVNPKIKKKVTLDYAYFAESFGDELTFTTADENDTSVAVKGNLIPIEQNKYDLGIADYTWREGHFERLFLGLFKLTRFDDGAGVYGVDVEVGSENTPSKSSWSRVGTTDVIYHKLSYYVMICIDCSVELSNDKWYKIRIDGAGDLSDPIVQITSKGAYDSSLHGDTHGGCLCAFVKDNYLYVGCDTNSNKDGFYAQIIAFSKNYFTDVTGLTLPDY